MKCAELVAIRIAHICQMDGAVFALTQAWRFFDRSTPIRNGYVMELLHLLR